MLPHSLSDVFTSLVVLIFIPFVILEFNYLYWGKKTCKCIFSFLKESTNTTKEHMGLSWYLPSALWLEQQLVGIPETGITAKEPPILDKRHLCQFQDVMSSE